MNPIRLSPGSGRPSIRLKQWIDSCLATKSGERSCLETDNSLSEEKAAPRGGFFVVFLKKITGQVGFRASESGIEASQVGFFNVRRKYNPLIYMYLYFIKTVFRCPTSFTLIFSIYPYFQLIAVHFCPTYRTGWTDYFHLRAPMQIQP